MAATTNVETCPRCGCVFGSHWSARIAELEADLESIHALVALQRERTVQAQAELVALTAAAETLTSLSSAVWSDEALRAVERVDELIGREETA